jgi:quinoprotein glucose dehydrogenase
VRTVGRLQLRSVGPTLEQLVANTNAPSQVRAEALQVMVDLGLPAVEGALDAARRDASEDLRNAATRLEGRMQSVNSLPRLSVTLQSGGIREQQAALGALRLLKGDAVDDLISEWVDRLLSGKVPKGLELDILETARTRSSPKLTRKLQQFEAARPSNDPLAAFHEALFGGDAAEGKRIFFEKAEAQCVRCHKIGGEGGDVGPDLSHVGSQRDRRYLLESIVLPNQQIAAGFDSVNLVLKNGDSYAGVLRSENADQLVLNAADTGLLSVKKTDIESRSASLSPMPEGLGLIIQKTELRDLVEFLSGLK